MRLEALFQPRSIAVIGASEKPTVGRRMVASLDRIGFAGAIYPFNPAYPTVLGHPCYPTLAECAGGARCRGVLSGSCSGFSTPSSRRRSAASRAR